MGLFGKKKVEEATAATSTPGDVSSKPTTPSLNDLYDSEFEDLPAGGAKHTGCSMCGYIAPDASVWHLHHILHALT